MKGKVNVSLMVILALSLAVVGVYFLYDFFYYNPKESVESFIVVHQEMSKDEVDTIYISHTNYKVNILPSNDNKVRIIYYQKTDNANSYLFSNKKISLTIPEKAETINSLLFHSAKSIDTIEIYVPQQGNYTIQIDSYDGKATINDVKLKQLGFKNGYGDLTIKNCEIGSIIANITESKVDISNSKVSNYAINVVSGEIKISLPDSLNSYSSKLETAYGDLLINNNQVTTMNEAEEIIVVNNYENEIKGACKLSVSSTRCNILISSIEENESKEVE